MAFPWKLNCNGRNSNSCGTHEGSRSRDRGARISRRLACHGLLHGVLRHRWVRAGDFRRHDEPALQRHLRPNCRQDPLELIRVYLTFPLGGDALQLAGAGQTAHAVSDGVILAIGCCLYLATGMLLGIPVYLGLTRFAAKGGLMARLAVASIISLAIWAFNFYGILSWLQPLVIGGDPGNWITNSSYLPWWVAAATHLVFGWTIALLYPVGQYTPYRRARDLKAA